MRYETIIQRFVILCKSITKHYRCFVQFGSFLFYKTYKNSARHTFIIDFVYNTTFVCGIIKNV